MYLIGLLLTGARREELAALKWSDIDFRWRKFTIADKVADKRTLPLPPYLSNLFRSLPRVKDSQYVFASAAAKSGHIVDPRKAQAAVEKIAQIEHVTLHGLRRTFSLLGEAAGCPAGAIAQIMGHVPSSMAENYRPRILDALRPFFEKAERFIVEQGGVEFDFNAA